ncbi:peroxidase [Athalia rosae]|uniref:peroxidase n=1 Tax=Athalia rosae TaxID=37344 RepID=UPI002033D697|nr:peroxidase [Athalia rosae]XP_048505446.1 peroxidase [Athalia rosae]
MAATERTPLTRPTDSSNYVEFSNILRTRTTRVRHFQCCVCATLLALFMMALVITVSYSVNQAINDSNITSPNNEKPPHLLQSNWKLPPSHINNEDKNSNALTDLEWQSGLTAGHKAIKRREEADAEATPLINPSPNSRHQFAVSTSVFAGRLALAGLAEIAATRTIESGRLLRGEKSSIGSYFDGGWAPGGTCKEFSNLICTRDKYRSLDGTCNHKKQWGSAFTPFRRSLPPEYADGLNLPRDGKMGSTLPSAREVSLLVHPPSPSSNPSFTVMLAVFGQFFDHDITATAISQGTNGSSLACCPPASRHPECFPVSVGPGDPVYDYTGNTCMEFVRSAPAPQCKLAPRQQLNQVSAFIDASLVYGATEPAAKALREGVGGRLEMQRTPDNRTLLPPSRNPNDGCNREVENARGRYCFASGDARANENLHLTTMHLLWARQHNRIADQLSSINPQWDDEILYQETRRIVAAQLQHISYKEFLPIVIGENAMKKHNLKPLISGYREEYNPKINPTIANEFAAAAFRFAHTLLPGLMRVTNAAKGTTSYIKLHKMLFNPYSLYAPGGFEDTITSATTNVIQQTSTHVTSQLTRHMFEDPVANSSVPCGLDLVSLNIQRGRDHGLPGYPAWREHCGLSRPNDFSDLKDDLDPDALEAMSKLYNSVDDIDLYSGALAELPSGDGLLGPTFTCLITDQFVRLQKGDRYWYETSEAPQAFTKDQLQEIRKISLAKLICECSDGVTRIQPEVMRAIGSDNPIESCQNIPGPSLDRWKERRNVVSVKLASTALSDWEVLKSDINETIQDIIDRVNATRENIGD